MKNAIVLVLATLATATAHAEIDAKIITNAKVKFVQCYKPVNLNHDEAVAGGIILEKDNDSVLKMNIVISRFADVEKQAASLCGKLRALKKSQQSTDVIYQEVPESNSTGVFKYILGVGKLEGANPFNEG